MGLGHFVDRHVVKRVTRPFGKRVSHGVRKGFRFLANPVRTLQRSRNTKGIFRPLAQGVNAIDLPQLWKQVKGQIERRAMKQAVANTGNSSAVSLQSSPRYTLDYRYRRLSDLS